MTFKEIVNRLSNWQRNQWARDGYPGLRHEDVRLLDPYITKKKKNTNK
jgi:hypothetical protein